MMLPMEHRQLLAPSCVVLAERVDPRPTGGDLLADVEMEALDKGCRHFPAPRGQSRLDCLTRAEDDAVCHPPEASAPIGFDHLRVEPSGQWHPRRLGPGVWRRSGGIPWPYWVSTAVRYSRQPAVRHSGAPCGASPWVPCCPKRWAMARVRSPTSMVRISVDTGSMATHPQGADRDRRVSALASVLSPVFTALSMAKRASRWTGVTWTSCRKDREKAVRWSAASTSHGRTVWGSTATTRATA